MDDRDRIEHRAPWVPWAITSLALLAVAAIAYNVGAHREAGALATEPARWRYSGFGGIWLFFLVFWIFGGLRWLWWGPHYYRPYRRYYSRYRDDRDDWEEWHRREHERLDKPAGSGPTSASGANQRPIT
jgi:hypothetical protein